MKGKLSGILVTGMMALFATSCASAAVHAQARHEEAKQVTTSASRVAPDAVPAVVLLSDPPKPSCAQPTPEIAATCRQEEQQILDTTVRIQVTRWQEADGRKGELISSNVSHATVKDGSYLVTHNHYGDALTILREQGAAGEIVRLSLFRADGELILSNVHPDELEIVEEDPETLVLRLKGAGKLGFFQMRGIPSASFAGGLASDLQPGSEVAQVDWDGQVSFVRWTTVEQLIQTDGVAQVVLDSYVQQGASGGGVFFNGIHIGNNWFRASEEVAESGQVLRQYSTVALNSAPLAAASAPDAAVAQVAPAEPVSQLPADPIQSGTGIVQE